jgi:hypothetical protein
MPLNLHIVVHKTEGLSQEELKGVIDAVSQCSNRWHSLSLDMPSSLLRAFLHNNPHHHLLWRLKLIVGSKWREEIDDFVPLLNPTASPEKIEIFGVPFQSLQISWNHLSFAKAHGFDLEAVVQLFENASQMTHCVLWGIRLGAKNFSMPPIIHQKLKTLSLSGVARVVKPMLFGSLTLPCLQEFHTDKILFLTPAYLPALVHRSSCPLTRITLLETYGGEAGLLDIMNALKPLPGVAELVLENPRFNQRDASIVGKIEDYFPNVRLLTLRLKVFLVLWRSREIPMLLGSNRPRPDSPNGGSLTILVVDEDQAQFDNMWDSDVGEQLKAWNICLKEDGFELSGVPLNWHADN